MLEAKDLDKLPVFLGAIVDTYRGIQNADVTRTYTKYVNMVRYLFQGCELTGWSNEDG